MLNKLANSALYEHSNLRAMDAEHDRLTDDTVELSFNSASICMNMLSLYLLWAQVVQNSELN
jgi:hypothetical protein